MWKKVSITLSIAVSLAILSSPVLAQDKVQELEKKVQALESQLSELKTMLLDQKEAAKTQAPIPAAPAVPASTAPLLTKLIGPGGTLQVGGDIRFRGEYFDNVWDFNSVNDSDQREVIRFRPRVFLDWKPTEDTEMYVRLAKEWVYGQDNIRFGYDVEGKDVMFDNAWGEWRNMFGLPLSLRLGRQDLIYGDGFVILDGTAQDGSQTTAFDAAKLSITHDWGTTDLLFAKLAEVNSQRADDEDLYGIYNKFKFADLKLGLEPYFLVRDKNNRPDFSGAAGQPDPFSGGAATPASYPFNNFDPSPKQQTFLLGMRATYDIDVADGVLLALAAEGGKEWGNLDFTDRSPVIGGSTAFDTTYGNRYGYSRYEFDDTVDRDAWGGEFHGTLSFTDTTWKPSVKAGVSYMSGDNPNTPEYEGWDDFYAEWPKYSELYVYTMYDGFKFLTQGNDREVGLWSNMILPEFMLTVKPTDRLTQSIRYLYFMADRSNGPGDGNERGHNFQWITNYIFNKNLTGNVVVEWFEPGDYYLDNADGALYARYQFIYSF
jgi:hypothetical protein